MSNSANDVYDLCISLDISLSLIAKYVDIVKWYGCILNRGLWKKIISMEAFYICYTYIMQYNLFKYIFTDNSI